MRVFITVKTYPTLSATYRELVYTAGLSDDGKWIRIYPIPFRRMDYDQRYKKYQWVNLDIARSTSDPRPESHRPTNIEAMQLLDEVDTENGTWATRRRLVLNVVHTNLGALIEQAKNTEIATSLATFKPQEILAFEYEATDREWDKDKLQQLNQLDLFDNAENPFEVVNKLPYNFFCMGRPLVEINRNEWNHSGVARREEDRSSPFKDRRRRRRENKESQMHERGGRMRRSQRGCLIVCSQYELS